MSESNNKVRRSEILQYDTFLYIHVPGIYMYVRRQSYMNPFKNNLDEEPGNITLNGRNKVAKKELNTITMENKFFVITGNES